MGPSRVSRARELAWDILASDDAILGIIVSDSEGTYLAYAATEGTGSKVLTDPEQIRRICTKEFLGLRLSPRPGQDSGGAEYVAYVYQNFKLLITELRDPPFVVGMKLAHCSNVEYLFSNVLQRYR